MTRLRMKRPSLAFVVAVVVLFVALGGVAGAASSGATWSSHGQGITNWRYQPDEHTAHRRQRQLAAGPQAGSRHLAGDISSTPAVVDGVVYVTDWGGKISALNASPGAVIWQTASRRLTGQSQARPVSRTSPAVSGNSVVIGTQKGGGSSSQLECDDTVPPELVRHELDPIIITRWRSSPSRRRSTTASSTTDSASTEENGINCDASPNACYFRGTRAPSISPPGRSSLDDVHALPAAAACRLLGRGGLGLLACRRRQRHSLYITTGNNYSAPHRDVQPRCAGRDGRRRSRRPCGLRAAEERQLRRRDHVARPDRPGTIKWTNKVQGYDAWTTACLGFPTACPTPAGPDFDSARARC